MAFTGTLNRDAQALLAKVAVTWPEDETVFVGCSGNFTCERVLAAVGRRAHGCDVSLYSCAVGEWLAGRHLPVHVEDPAWDWLQPYLEPGVSQAASLMLCTSMLAETRRGAYFTRQLAGYQRQWPTLHEKTMAKITAAVGELRLAGFTIGDAVDLALEQPPDIPIVMYPPPTGSKGYDKLYENIDAAFGWDRPDVPARDAADFEQLFVDEIAPSGRPFFLVLDHESPPIHDTEIARLQVNPGARPLHVFANPQPPTLTKPKPTTMGELRVRRCEGLPMGALRLARITVGQMQLLQAEYLVAVTPARPWAAFAVLAGDELIGAFSIGATSQTHRQGEVVLVCDMAVRPTRARHLSKLVLCAVVSKEAQVLLQETANTQIRGFSTAVFTTRPASSKYRGLWQLRERKKDPPRLIYTAAAGRWTLDEAMAWWAERHGDEADGGGADDE